jgi:cell division protein FtsL
MEKEKKSHGALIGSIIVVVLLIIGGIYVWQTKIKETQLLNQKIQEEISKINEENINELDSLEVEISSIETELDDEIINSVE